MLSDDLGLLVEPEVPKEEVVPSDPLDPLDRVDIVDSVDMVDSVDRAEYRLASFRCSVNKYFTTRTNAL